MSGPITFLGFHNALRVMLNVEMDDLVKARIFAPDDIDGYRKFSADPYRWFIRADQVTADRFWRIVGPRINSARAARTPDRSERVR